MNLENILKWFFLIFALIYLRQKEFAIAKRILEIHDFVIKIPFWIKKSWTDRKLRRFWIIFLVNMIIKTTIDLFLTPYLIIKIGYKSSLFYTIFIYFFIGVVSLSVYDYYKTDVFGIEILKKNQSRNTNTKDQNALIRFILKQDELTKFFFELLLFFKNPAFWVIYTRDGEGLYNGFVGKNIKLHFIYYLLVMNVYWNTMVALGISLWKILWKLILLIF